jgi:hypothetical protein
MDESEALLEAELDKLREAIEVCDALMGVELPRNLKEATEGSWDLGVDVAAAGLSLTGYPLDEQKEDRQRVVPMRAAVKAVFQFESEMMDDMVRNDAGSRALLHGILGWVTTLYNVAAFLRGLWKWRKVLSLNAIKYLLLNHFTEFVSVLTIASSVVAGLKAAESSEKKMRKAVLPQGFGQRYSRRKRARC